MGNQPSAMAPTQQEQQEAAVRALVSEGAGRSARLAISRALDHSQAGNGGEPAADQADVILPLGEQQFAAVSGALVGGVLPVQLAAEAAAKGALLAIKSMEPSLRPESWPCSGADFIDYRSSMRKLEISAATSATTAVYTVAALYAANRRGVDLEGPLSLDLPFTEVVVAAVTRACCLRSFSEKQAPVNRWATILTPILAACLPTVAASYPEFVNRNPWIVQGFCGGILLLVLSLMMGVLAVPLRPNCRPERISRHCTFISMLLIMVLGTATFATHFSCWGFRSVPLVMGFVAVVCLIILWCLSCTR